jgi:4-amino-4-deoxy-L-arabinose transferase-like glycosyltransferase
VSRRLPPRGALAIGAATSALLVAVANRYGWHRDELYFLEAGHNLAWGYVDQPPFTPAVARLAHEVAPGNLVVLRLLPALAIGAAAVVGALVVRELGGDERRQVLGAGVVAAGGFTLGVGHLLSTATFDLLAWLVVLWLVARLLRTGDQRLWLAVGSVVGVAMLNKNLVVLLVASLAVGLAVERRWDLLVSPWLVGGVALAGLLASPHLAWQVANDWPQFAMADALEARIGGENRLLLVPLQVLFLGPLLVGVLVVGGRWLAGEGRAFRPLLWAWPAGLVLTLVAGGRPYYVLPLTIVVALAGVAGAPGPGLRWATVAASGAFAVLVALPVLPVGAVSVTGAVNEAVAETVGWPELVAQVAGVVDSLPPDEQDGVVILTGTYGEAGAIDRFGAPHGLPPAYSPHNGYADFGRPTDDDATVVAVRFALDGRLAPYFDECTEVGVVDNGLDIDNEVQGAPILVCRGLRGSWDEVWEELRFLA